VLRIDHPDVFKPEDEGTDTAHGDAEAGLRDAATTIDATYTTPHEHQGAMEPHTSVALWSDDTLPYSHVPGGSAGITSWGATLFGAARAFRDRHGNDPAPGDAVTAGAPENPAEDAYAMHACGAHLPRSASTPTPVRCAVPRMPGTFAGGRVVNPSTARSQLTAA
jgi:CO/xanthine dehydrogenase Mo-binding subunit